MPFYTYGCPKCDFEIDYMHGIRETPVYICGQCGAQLKKRLSSSVKIRGAGDGWFGKSKKRKGSLE